MFLKPVPYRRTFGEHVPGGLYHAPGIRIPVRRGSTVCMPRDCVATVSTGNAKEMILCFGSLVGDEDLDDEGRFSIVVKCVSDPRTGHRKAGSCLAKTINSFVDVQAFDARVAAGNWKWLQGAPSPAWLISPGEAFRRIGVKHRSKQRAKSSRVEAHEEPIPGQLAATLILGGVLGLAWLGRS